MFVGTIIVPWYYLGRASAVRFLEYLRVGMWFCLSCMMKHQRMEVLFGQGSCCMKRTILLCFAQRPLVPPFSAPVTLIPYVLPTKYNVLPSNYIL